MLSRSEGWHTLTPLSITETLPNCQGCKLMYAKEGRQYFPSSVWRNMSSSLAGFTILGGRLIKKNDFIVTLCEHTSYKSLCIIIETIMYYSESININL